MECCAYDTIIGCGDGRMDKPIILVPMDADIVTALDAPGRNMGSPARN